ncbi:RNA polymerase sigma factor [Acinetobacter boissieri]|uniref:RNA polymerase sigma-70 factor, ECF subfamily n=1 Tax=Acinetobacter boissieri TaxID=1219383 RepID=A0A1G6J4W9_9GAMM|nr:RNA polymerase sigma factor [Acinetobacter boissieri]SDC13780.1 RNA polymerase sigma-70 factor, ECF subfamily [Acinetobacter boissieri]
MEKCTHLDSFHQFYHQHYGWLYQWLSKYFTCSSQIDDIIQDTFYKIILRPELMTEIKDARPFLAKTAKNMIIDRARRTKIEKNYICTLDHEHYEGCATTPLEHVISMELATQITLAIDNLEDRPKQVITMYYLQGISQVNIAKKLSLSTKTIQADLIKAISYCKHHIQNI